MVGLDLNDFKTQRAIGIILAGLVVGGLIWYFMIKDKSDELSGLKAVTAQRNDELNQILTLRPHLEKMRVTVAELQREMDSLEAMFPMNPDVPGLITNFTQVARTQRITIMNFRPAGVLRQEFYVENYYEMSILGSYHNVGNFLAQVANFDLLVNIDRVNLRTSPTLTNDLQNFESYRGSRGPDEMIQSVQVGFRVTTYSSLQGATGD